MKTDKEKFNEVLDIWFSGYEFFDNTKLTQYGTKRI